MYCPPNSRGVNVLLSFPRILGARDSMTYTVIALVIAIVVDVFISYTTPVYIIIILTAFIAFMGYYVTDAVFQAGCYGVANKYPSVAYGSFWYCLFVKKLEFKNSNDVMWRKDVSSFLWIIHFCFLRYLVVF